VFIILIIAKILAFNVKPLRPVKSAAEKRKVDIRIYNIIYRLIDDVTEMLIALLPKTYSEKVSGVSEIIAIFTLNANTSEEAKVAGCIITEGYVKRDNDPLTEVRILRRSKTIYTGKIKELRHLKKDIITANKGMECGMLFDNFIDFQEGDIIHYITKSPIKGSL
jgi:translation initiation factor IF-2